MYIVYTPSNAEPHLSTREVRPQLLRRGGVEGHGVYRPADGKAIEHAASTPCEPSAQKSYNYTNITDYNIYIYLFTYLFIYLFIYPFIYLFMIIYVFIYL